MPRKHFRPHPPSWIYEFRKLDLTFELLVEKYPLLPDFAKIDAIGAEIRGAGMTCRREGGEEHGEPYDNGVVTS